ncbi:MAG TPA: hypothetical protein VI338_03350, partial [Nitrososphaera sp.]|nr:hypothetical protein [Nitrososphaera sp.]
MSQRGCRGKRITSLTTCNISACDRCLNFRFERLNCTLTHTEKIKQRPWLDKKDWREIHDILRIQLASKR